MSWAVFLSRYHLRMTVYYHSIRWCFFFIIPFLMSSQHVDILSYWMMFISRYYLGIMIHYLPIACCFWPDIILVVAISYTTGRCFSPYIRVSTTRCHHSGRGFSTDLIVIVSSGNCVTYFLNKSYFEVYLYLLNKVVWIIDSSSWITDQITVHYLHHKGHCL